MCEIEVEISYGLFIKNLNIEGEEKCEWQGGALFGENLTNEAGKSV